MQITPSVASALLTTFTRPLSGGSIEIYAGSPPSGIQDRLTSIPLARPAFAVNEQGHAVALGVLSSVILVSGTAGWAQLLSGDGEVVADLTVGTDSGSDLVVDRTDFQRGGTCTLDAVTLRLPLQS